MGGCSGVGCVCTAGLVWHATHVWVGGGPGAAVLLVAAAAAAPATWNSLSPQTRLNQHSYSCTALLDCHRTAAAAAVSLQVSVEGCVQDTHHCPGCQPACLTGQPDVLVEAALHFPPYSAVAARTLRRATRHRQRQGHHRQAGCAGDCCSHCQA